MDFRFISNSVFSLHLLLYSSSRRCINYKWFRQVLVTFEQRHAIFMLLARHSINNSMLTYGLAAGNKSLPGFLNSSQELWLTDIWLIDSTEYWCICPILSVTKYVFWYFLWYDCGSFTLEEIGFCWTLKLFPIELSPLINADNLFLYFFFFLSLLFFWFVAVFEVCHSLFEVLFGEGSMKFW